MDEVAVNETGYRVAADRSFSVERVIEAAGETSPVEVTAHMVHLQRPSPVGVPAQVVTVAAPDIELLGQQINVVREVGPLNLVGRAESSVEDIEQEQKIDEESVSVLGDTHTVEVYEGTATHEGEESPVHMLVSTMDADDDTIVAVAIVPRAMPDAEGTALQAIEAIERP